MEAKKFEKELLKALDNLTPEDIKRVRKEVGEEDYKKPENLKGFYIQGLENDPE